jgi:NAD(P)-dependent dehydrogenase (short-subunit alcohol dehydrogenase family)
MDDIWQASRSHQPRITSQVANLDVLQKIIAVNTFGSLFVSQAFVPDLLKSSKPKLGILTSRVGNVGDNKSGGMYIYRSSNAAANQIARILAMDLKEQGIHRRCASSILRS